MLVLRTIVYLSRGCSVLGISPGVTELSLGKVDGTRNVEHGKVAGTPVQHCSFCNTIYRTMYNSCLHFRSSLRANECSGGVDLIPEIKGSIKEPMPHNSSKAL